MRVALVSSCLTALILAAVYALRGIWPFGTDNVAYMDFAQFYIQYFYSLWDYLHANPLPAVWRDLLYPYNWPFLFVARGHVLEAVGLYIAIHMMLIAAIAGIALDIRFPRVNWLWKTVFALLYAFSGFVLQYYSNHNWMSIVAAFPLLLLGLERLLREGKYVWYTVMYIFFLNAGVYFAYMVTVYLVMFSLGYCLLVLPKEKRGDRIFRLGMATAAAVGICSRNWMGEAVSMSGGARFQENLESGIEAGMTTWDITNTRHTFLMLMGMSLVAALFVLTLRRQRTAPPDTRPARRRAIRFGLYMAGVFALPMIFTNIDTAWHFGQYNFFPMRYGYVIPATFIGFGCLAVEDGLSCPAPPALEAPRRPWLPWAAAAVSGLGILLLEPRLARIFREYGACFLTSLGAAGYLRYFAMYVLCGVLFAVLYYVLLHLSPRRAAWAVAAAVVLQIGANAWGNIAPNDDHTYTHEYDPAYIETSDQLYDYFQDHPSAPLARVKNTDNSLNAGYPIIAGVSALSSVDSGRSAGEIAVYRGLGYTVNYSRVLDTGGTVFSDMLLNVDRVLSAIPLDGDLYLPGDTAAGMQIGSCRYPGVLGLMYDEDALEDYFDLTTLTDRLNALYGAFTDSEDALAADLDPEITTAGTGMREYTLTCRLEAPAFLYMALDGMAMNITMNGQPVAVPSYQNLTNTVYPAPFNSNLLCLGLAEKGEVAIRFSSGMDLTAEDLTLVGLDKGALDSFREDANLDGDMTLEQNGRGYTINITVDQAGRQLFLPILDPWSYSCTVNGEPAPLSFFIGIMTSVPLQEGRNTVVLARGGSGGARFTFTRDRILPTVCLALCLLWLVLRQVFPKLRTLVLPRFVYAVFQVMFYAVSAAIICFIFITPMYNLLTNGQIIWF